MTIATPREIPQVAAMPATPGSTETVAVQPLGLVAALLVCAWIVSLDRRVAHPVLWTSSAALTSLIALAGPIRSRGLSTRFVLATAQLVTMAALVVTGDRAISAWEERAPRFGLMSSAASAGLNLLGYTTVAERGLLLLDHPDGEVTVVPSFEKIEVGPFVLFGIVWLALRLIGGHRGLAAPSLIALMAVTAVAVVRYVAVLALYAEHDEILAGRIGLTAVDTFTSPWITGAFLIIAGVVIDRMVACVFVDSANRLRAYRAHRAEWRTVARGAALAAVASLAGFAFSFAPAGAEKTGRILVDDRYCGIWEPTARRLDTKWYGDFATYSFTSLAEWLGKWYSVDANTSRAYNDELLEGYDVLIIKTPEEPIPDAELAAIDRFVRRGGGLLLVGDHTNLLGMGTHLNALSARHGIRFRYDSVSDGITGGFVDYFGPRVGRHVGALHVDHLQFMTSCSLEVSGPVEVVLASGDCRREPHDYAGSSFFGRRRAHPEMAQGRTVLAATVKVGRGRIAAFTDSTVWSSFAVFSHDRQKLAMDLVRLLNREPSPYELPIRGLAVAAALIAVLLGLGMVRSGLALPAILLGLLGLWSGAALSEGLHRWLYVWPKPNAPVSEVAFLWQGGACAFPPVLGTPESIPADRSFDTLLVSVQRLGLVPRVAFTYDKDLFTPATRAIFVIAPVNSPPTETVARLKDFVCRGGCLIVLDDNRIGERGSGERLPGPLRRLDHLPRGTRTRRRRAAARPPRRGDGASACAGRRCVCGPEAG